jgi:hypothetical protein
MATVKLQDGKVVLKDGKVSCSCCDLCPITTFTELVEITKEQNAAINRGGTLSFSISATVDQALPNDCGGGPNARAQYSDSSSYSIAPKTCFFNEGIGIQTNMLFFFNRLRSANPSRFFLVISAQSFGGYSGPAWAFVQPQAVISNPFISSTASSLTIDGEEVPSGITVFQPSATFPIGFNCTLTLVANVSFTSNPE